MKPRLVFRNGFYFVEAGANSFTTTNVKSAIRRLVELSK